MDVEQWLDLSEDLTRDCVSHGASQGELSSMRMTYRLGVLIGFMKAYGVVTDQELSDADRIDRLNELYDKVEAIQKDITALA